MSATANLPDLGAARDTATNAQKGLSSFVQVAGSLGKSDAGSPLGAVHQAFGGIEGSLQIDVTGITQRLPHAITTIENAVPSDALAFVENLRHSYAGVSDFLSNSPIVKQIQPGRSLEQTALAIVESILDQFGQRLADLAGSLVDADTLARVTKALNTLEQLAGGQTLAPAELLDFLVQQLAGVERDLLDDARKHVDTSLALLDPLTAASLEARIGAARDTAQAAFEQAAVAVRDFDPNDAAAYGALEALLQAWSNAIDAAFDVADAAYAALTPVVAAPAWDTMFSAYAAVLAAVPLEDVPTVDDVVDQISAVIESLLSSLRMTLSPQDLAKRVAVVSTAIHEAFAQSPLSQVQQILISFIGDIQSAIEAVPTEEVDKAVTSMLQRVKQELDALHIDQVRSGIADGFRRAHDFIDENVGDDLLGGVRDTLDAALNQFDQIPIADLGEAIAGAVQQVGDVIHQLAGELSSALDELKSLLAELDGVDFRPVADEVVDEINALKSKLAAIKPDALSDVEKIAIQAGLAILRALDLKGLIEGELKQGFAAIENPLVKAVQAVLNTWLEFRNRIGGFNGASIAAPVNALLDDVGKTVNGVNGTLVLAPLDSLVDQLLAQAATLSPAALLEPLKGPYQRMMATIDRANPDVWVEPLRLLHAEIDRLITLIDITPLLDTLEQKERALFAQARDGLAAALAGVHLPAPLDGFFDAMKSLMLGLADAVFGDPDGSLRQFNATLAANVKPSTLFKPLDDAFDRLVAAIDTLPTADVLVALEAVRGGLGAVLPALNPAVVLATMRDAQSRLESLQPSTLADVVALPALRVQLDAQLALSTGHETAKASLQARFDLVLVPLNVDDPQSRLQQLDARHRALVTALRQRINGLDASGAQAAYARLDAGLSRLLPAFLRQPEPLTMSDVRAGLATLRPSTKARRIDLAVDRFLADLAPLQSEIGDAVNGFFAEIRNAALLLHPAGLKQAVSGVYAALRKKLDVLDPDTLSQELRTTIWDPLIDPLKAIDPAAIQHELDALYRQLLDKLATTLRNILAQLKEAIDGFLVKVRAALKQVLDALKVKLDAILADVTQLLQQLDQLIVHELFERLLALLANLETSFNQQLDRVRHEFDAMLDAIPLGSASATVAA